MKSIKRIFKKEEVFWAAIPIITWKKEVKKVYGTWLYYETNKKNTNYYEISGIASWRNFFLPLIIVFEISGDLFNTNLLHIFIQLLSNM